MVDVFLFGSALKSKEKPKDIDLIALFRQKNFELIEDVLYKIKKIGEKLSMKIHAEPLIVDTMHKQRVYATLLHEGLSIKYNKLLSQMLGFSSFLLITYSLKNKTASEKVRFSYALYGRQKGKGLLGSLKGKEAGRGAILVPIDKQGIARDFFKQWAVDYKEQRIVIFE